VAQFKRDDFSTCDAHRPGRPKTVTTPAIIDKIHELILEDHRIYATSIAEQLGISRDRVGSIIYKDLDMRKLSAKWVPKCLNADKNVNGVSRLRKFRKFFGRHPNDFLSRLVTMDETFLYHYDPETKQQSMEWRHSGSTRPKKIRVQKSAGKVLASIFGIKTASSSLIMFHRAKYQRGVLFISAGATEGHFEGKMPREVHQGGFVLARQYPGSPGTCNPEETGLPGLPVS